MTEELCAECRKPMRSMVTGLGAVSKVAGPPTYGFGRRNEASLRYLDGRLVHLRCVPRELLIGEKE